MSLPLANCNPCETCPPTNAVNLPPCPPDSEPCEEVVYAECTKYKGPNLPALGVSYNDRFDTVLTKLHKAINDLLDPAIDRITYTATATTATPYVVTYLDLGPVYTSTAGATSSGSTITVGSTTGLVAGMTLEVTAGTGAFTPGTTVLTVTNTTQFTVSQAPSTALSGGATVIKATGSNHNIFKITVAQGTPQSFKAFAGSPQALSGTGTIV
jgi:hypothetical protein